MSRREGQAMLAIIGFGLIGGGHRLMNAELGRLGAPHYLGAALLALALKS